MKLYWLNKSDSSKEILDPWMSKKLKAYLLENQIEYLVCLMMDCYLFSMKEVIVATTWEKLSLNMLINRKSSKNVYTTLFQ